MSFLRVENVSISCVLQRRYTRRSGRGWRTISTDFSAEHATTTTTTIYTVNFASRYIQQMVKMRMMTNGLVATTVRDGYS